MGSVSVFHRRTSSLLLCSIPTNIPSRFSAVPKVSCPATLPKTSQNTARCPISCVALLQGRRCLAATLPCKRALHPDLTSGVRRVFGLLPIPFSRRQAETSADTDTCRTRRRSLVRFVVFSSSFYFCPSRQGPAEGGFDLSPVFISWLKPFTPSRSPTR